VVAIVSMGYEGWTPDGFVDALVGAEVTLLVDVRLNAISRKRGFSKRGLAAALAGAGIGYRHEPSLGNPVDNRDAFRRGDATARERVRAALEGPASATVDRLVEDVAAGGVAVLCVERDASICHRTVVIDALRRRLPALEVVEVQPP
jgi:uncharacterized protein (DUF488 family)